ncbi:MAG: transposase family protein [Isosphaeraceae bacterium]
MASAPDSAAALRPRDAASILDHLDDLSDPTRAANRTGSIVFIATCAVLCGADTWVQIADHGRSKFDGLATFLELPGSIPSDSSTGRATTG